MSGALPEDQAGLYVLGALNAEEMRSIRVAAGRDAALAGEIANWERRLAPLVRLVPEATPPATLWPQLEARLARLAGGTAASAEVYQIAAQRPRVRRSRGAPGLNYWRAATVAAMALAASLAGIIITRAPPRVPRLAMILPARPGEGGWLVQVNDRGEVKVQANGALSRALDQDYELWAMPVGSDRPLPLGLLPVTASATIKPANLPKAKFKLLVSLEPKGGSPTGLPTGPVMYSGDFASP